MPSTRYANALQHSQQTFRSMMDAERRACEKLVLDRMSPDFRKTYAQIKRVAGGDNFGRTLSPGITVHLLVLCHQTLQPLIHLTWALQMRLHEHRQTAMECSMHNATKNCSSERPSNIVLMCTSSGHYFGLVIGAT